jgi:hypothetical protein
MPHLSIGSLDIAGEFRRVHQGGLLHPAAKGRAEMLESRQVAGQICRNVYELIGGVGRQFLQAEV